MSKKHSILGRQKVADPIRSEPFTETIADDRLVLVSVEIAALDGALIAETPLR